MRISSRSLKNANEHRSTGIVMCELGEGGVHLRSVKERLSSAR